MIYSEGFSMQKRIKPLLVAAAIFSGIGCAFAGEPAVITAASGLSLREKPARNAKLIVKLLQGTKVEIIDKNGPTEQIEGKRSNWFKVISGSRTGWAFGGFIQENASKPETGKPEVTPKSPAIPATAVEKNDTESPPADPDFIDNEAETDEKTVLRRFSAKVVRKGKTLRLNCAGDRKVEFTSDDSGGESHVMYYCIDYIQPEGLFLIYAQLYEGSEHFFVSEATGKTVNLGDRPIFSPQRSRVAVAGLDITAAYDFNGLRIFKIEKDGLQLEFELEPENWGPENFKWESETAASFAKVSMNEKAEFKSTPARLELAAESKKWLITENPAKPAANKILPAKKGN